MRVFIHVLSLGANTNLNGRYRVITAVGVVSRSPIMDLPFSGIISGAKRPLSPGSDYTPGPSRKKTQAKTKSRKGKTHRDRVAISEGADTECGQVPGMDHNPLARVAPTAASAGERNAVEWTFMSNPRIQDSSLREQAHAQPVPSSSTPIPRIWTNVRPTRTVFQAREVDIVVCSHRKGF